LIIPPQYVVFDKQYGKSEKPVYVLFSLLYAALLLTAQVNIDLHG
jgi:hypothetical protein